MVETGTLAVLQSGHYCTEPNYFTASSSPLYPYPQGAIFEDKITVDGIHQGIDMATLAEIHAESFRVNEKSWNDKAEFPVALFIGLSPPKKKYFRCFRNHGPDADCSKLSSRSRSFLNYILDVVSSSGFEIAGVSKEDKVESLSKDFCVVDLFKSHPEMRHSLRQFKKGKYEDSVVGDPMDAVKEIVRRCSERGHKLRIVAALGPCVNPACNSDEGRGMWGFRWRLWDSLQRSVEDELKDGVVFVRRDGAHLFKDDEAWLSWKSLVSGVLLEVRVERTQGANSKGITR